MAFKRYIIDGFGQLELNNVAFRRDGRIEAQCGLLKADFENVPCENGMVLAVDKSNKVVKFAKAGNILPLALNYSTEHMYDERANALKDFATIWKDNNEYFFPRMGYLAVGDLFTTNCFGSSELADNDAMDEAIAKIHDKDEPIPLYAVASEEGAWDLIAEAPEAGMFAEVVKGFTMPDGTPAVQLRVLAV